MASFADALARANGLDAGQVTWIRGIDQDAPDFKVTLVDQIMDIELTALTAGALRAERRRLSDVAEQVRDVIAGQTELTTALDGWAVDLSDAATRPMPTGPIAAAIASRIASFLAASGSWNALLPRDDATATAEAATPEGPEGGGEVVASPDVINGIRVRLVRHGAIGVRFVTHSSQATLTLREARRKLADRLLDKNTKMRENVVICAGDPDRDGVVLPLDVAEFELLQVFGCGELPPTSYIKRAWLHLSGSTELIPLSLVTDPE
jgi:hypothetical protein